MQEAEKKAAGQAAAGLVSDGMTLGLGTGSTVDHFLVALGDRVREGLRVSGIPTSERTAARCRELGIALTGFASVDRIDLTVDGADEIDGRLDMIKGGGGALLREKIVASAAGRVAIIVDSGKVVDALGAFPVPVEVTRFGHEWVEQKLRVGGIECGLRMAGDDPYVTDNDHYILDCRMGRIEDAPALDAEIQAIPGVVETGLFVGLCHTLIVGRGDTAEFHERGT